MKIFKALLIILVIPAILYVTGVFQDYADEYMTLNTLEEIFMNFLPFIIIGLYIFGIFKIIGHRNNKGE